MSMPFLDDEFNFDDINLEFLNSPPHKARDGEPSIKARNSPVQSFTPSSAKLFKNEELKENSIQRLSQRIAQVDSLVSQIRKVEGEREALRKQLEELHESAKEIQSLYAKEKQKCLEEKTKNEELNRKCQDLDADLTNKTLEADQLQGRLDSLKGPIAYDELAVRYLKLIQKVDEQLHWHDSVVVKDLQKYCKENNLKIRPINPRTPRKRKISVAKIDAETQCDIEIVNKVKAGEQEVREMRDQCTQFSKRPTRNQGCQHIGTTTTRSTTTACFFKYHDVGVNCNLLDFKFALNEMLNDMCSWSTSVAAPLSPIADLDTMPPSNWSESIDLLPPPPPDPPVPSIKIKTVGICTNLCNVQRHIDYYTALPLSCIKRSDSRPPSRAMLESVKDENTTTQSNSTSSPLAFNLMNNQLPSMQNILPSAFDELWQIFGHMVYGLLQRRTGSTATFNNPSIAPGNITNQQEFINWMQSLYLDLQSEGRTQPILNSDTLGSNTDTNTTIENDREGSIAAENNAEAQQTVEHIVASPLNFSNLAPVKCTASSQYLCKPKAQRGGKNNVDEIASTKCSERHSIGTSPIQCIVSSPSFLENKVNKEDENDVEARTPSAFVSRKLQDSNGANKPEIPLKLSKTAQKVLQLFPSSNNCSETLDSLEKLLNKRRKKSKMKRMKKHKRKRLSKVVLNMENETAVDFITKLNTFNGSQNKDEKNFEGAEDRKSNRLSEKKNISKRKTQQLTKMREIFGSDEDETDSIEANSFPLNKLNDHNIDSKDSNIVLPSNEKKSCKNNHHQTSLNGENLEANVMANADGSTKFSAISVENDKSSNADEMDSPVKEQIYEKQISSPAKEERRHLSPDENTQNEIFFHSSTERLGNSSSNSNSSDSSPSVDGLTYKTDDFMKEQQVERVISTAEMEEGHLPPLSFVKNNSMSTETAADLIPKNDETIASTNNFSNAVKIDSPMKQIAPSSKIDVGHFSADDICKTPEPCSEGLENFSPTRDLSISSPESKLVIISDNEEIMDLEPIATLPKKRGRKRKSESSLSCTPTSTLATRSSPQPFKRSARLFEKRKIFEEHNHGTSLTLLMLGKYTRRSNSNKDESKSEKINMKKDCVEDGKIKEETETETETETSNHADQPNEKNKVLEGEDLTTVHVENIESLMSFSSPSASPASPTPPTDNLKIINDNEIKKIPLDNLEEDFGKRRKRSTLHNLIRNYGNHKYCPYNLNQLNEEEKAELCQLEGYLKNFLAPNTAQSEDAAVQLVDFVLSTTENMNVIAQAICSVIQQEPRPATTPYEKLKEVHLLNQSMPSYIYEKMSNVMRHLIERKPPLTQTLLNVIDSILFNLQNSDSSTVTTTLNLTDLFLLTLKLQPMASVSQTTTENPARLFVAKCLYYYKVKAIPMIYAVLLIFPTTLPHREETNYDRSDALITVIQHALMFVTYDMENHELFHREMLSKLRYSYHFEVFKPDFNDVLQNLLEKLRTGKHDNLKYAFAIFCKRLSPDRIVRDIIQPNLIPMSNEYYSVLPKTTEYDEQAAALLDCFSMIVKPFPRDTTSPACAEISNYMNIFKRFLSVVERKIIQEAAVHAILRLQRFSYINCYKALASFSPNYELQPVTRAALLTFIQRKPLNFWKTMLSQSS